MLGPMFALLLLTSPAAGPVAQQSCWLLCETPTTSNQPSAIDRLLGQDPASLRDRVERLERVQQQQQNPLYVPSSSGSALFPQHGQQQHELPAQPLLTAAQDTPGAPVTMTGAPASEEMMPDVTIWECWGCDTDTPGHRCGGYYAGYNDDETGDWCATVEEAQADAERFHGRPLAWTWLAGKDTEMLAWAPIH